MTEFYSRLKAINDFHRKYPDTPADPFALELEGILGEIEYDEDQEDRAFTSMVLSIPFH